MKMRRLLGAALAVCLTCTSVVCVNAAGTVSLAAAETTVEAGKSTGDSAYEIKITDLGEGTSVNNLTFWVTYDASVAKATKVKMVAEDGTLYDATEQVNYTITEEHVTNDPDHYTAADVGKTAFEAGVVKIAFVYGGFNMGELLAFNSETPVAAFTFEGVAAGSTDVKLSIVDCNDIPSETDDTAITATASFGKITVTSEEEPTPSDRLLGDVHKDDSVDSTDATEILLYKAGLLDLDEESLRVADVNIDNEVNSTDATQILLYKAGLGSLGK